MNAHDQFAIPAITPVILNICLIVAAAVVSPHLTQPVYALAWGVLIAGVIQLLFQVPFLKRIGLLPHPKVDWTDRSVRKVLKLMAPAMFGVSVGQINLLLDTIIASFLPTGSVSWLYFSDRLMELPLGVFGVGIATVILPVLSRQFTRGENYSLTLDWAMRMIILIGIPATIALSYLAQPILFTLFQYQATGVQDVLMSSFSLCAYAIGLTAFMLVKVFAGAFFSRQDMRTPVKIGIIAMVSNMVLNLIFVLPLHFYGHIGHVGLAAATSVSALINASLLYRELKRAEVFIPQQGWSKFILQLLVSNIVLLAVLFGADTFIDSFIGMSWQQRLFNLLLFVSSGFGAYVCSLYIMGIRINQLRISVE